MTASSARPSSVPVPDAAAISPTATIDEQGLLPWSIDLVGALVHVSQIRDPAGALLLAQQWRLQEARARTPFLLLRILALTRAFELQEEYATLHSRSKWTPPQVIAILSSLPRSEQVRVKSYGTRLREFGQSHGFLDATFGGLSSAAHLRTLRLFLFVSPVNRHIEPTFRSPVRPWRGTLAWKLFLLNRSIDHQRRLLSVSVSADSIAGQHIAPCDCSLVSLFALASGGYVTSECLDPASNIACTLAQWPARSATVYRR